MYALQEELSSLTRREMQERVNLLGNTRLQAINVVIQGVARTIHLKTESDNPTGSVKDRTAYSLLRDLDAQGLLHKDSVIVESTSGNLGVALAYLCKLYGYGFIAVVDPKTTVENVERIRALGADIEMVTQPDEYGGYLLSRIAFIQRLCQRSPRYVWPNQYANPANPQVHEGTTGPEIYNQMNGQIDALFIAVSTGGTLVGISNYIRRVSPQTRILGVDAYGSVVFGGPAAPRKLTGIGASQPSRFIHRHTYDDHLMVTDEEAFSFCHALYDTTGISVGGSSGAVLSACTRYLENHPELRNIVCLCPDGGRNYASSIYNDAWLEANHLHIGTHHLGPVQDIELAR
jgi:cysteine synthase A